MPTSFGHLELDNAFDQLHNTFINKEYNLENFGLLAEYWNFLNSTKPKSFSDHLRFERYKASCNEKLNSCVMQVCYLKHKRFKESHPDTYSSKKFELFL